MRGNDSWCRLGSWWSRGSPPLARERHEHYQGREPEFGITPACAGTTSNSSVVSGSIRDHPRLRGNDMIMRTRKIFSVGSPPLARERQVYFLHFTGLERITPACAGTTYFWLLYQPPAQDHPRLRGNDLSDFSEETQDLGSPPLARERRKVIADVNPSTGITPACAGTTTLASWTQRIKWDHPRLRGNDE